MRDGIPSRTAQGVAIRRAEHQLFDFPHVLEDPIAPWIVGPSGPYIYIVDSLTAYLQPQRYLRAFMAARSRYAEDQLARSISAGTLQYVILGAGLDTFPYRNPHSQSKLRVFEVDHPDTQGWKRRRLAQLGIPIPSSLTFVPVNFENQRLEPELERSGFKLDEPAFFSWLGVTPYLPREVVMATLKLIHALCSENAIAFDYALPREALSLGEQLAFDVMSNGVARAGEPFRSFFEPEVLAGKLTDMGFRRVERPTTDHLNAMYFRNRLDGLKVRGRLGGLMCAL